METSVSQPVASACAARYSSFRTLLPPYASPELQSSRFAQISTSPPRCSLSLSRRWIGDGPNSNGTRSNASMPIRPILCRASRQFLAHARDDLAAEKIDRAEDPLVRDPADRELQQEAVVAEELVLEEDLVDHFL